MNKLRQLYDFSFSDSDHLKDESLKRRDTYLAYKKMYISKCREERKSNYTFLQRNKFLIVLVWFILLVSVGVLLINVLGSNTETNKEVKNTNIETQQAMDDSSNISAADAGEKEDHSEMAEAQSGNEKIIDDNLSTNREQEETIEIGMEVNFVGNVHYKTSFSGSESSKCKAGKAIVTKINRKEAHPYHLKSNEKSCTVYGWVDEKDIVIDNAKKS